MLFQNEIQLALPHIYRWILELIKKTIETPEQINNNKSQLNQKEILIKIF